MGYADRACDLVFLELAAEATLATSSPSYKIDQAPMIGMPNLGCGSRPARCLYQRGIPTGNHCNRRACAAARNLDQRLRDTRSNAVGRIGVIGQLDRSSRP